MTRYPVGMTRGVPGGTGAAGRIRRMLRRAFPAACVLVLVLWPAAARAQVRVGQTPSDQVVLRGDVVVARGQVVGEVVVFHGSVTVGGVVRGDVVVLDGQVTIAGQVSGDVIAVHGAIRVLATAQIAGSVRGGSDVVVADGAQVGGGVARGVRFTLSGPLGALGALLAAAAVSVSALVMALLLWWASPRGVERAATAGRERPLASAIWGVAVALALPVGALLAAATVLGLPFGLAVLLAVGALWLLGLAATTWVIGRALVRTPRRAGAALAAGWGIAVAVGLVPVLNVVWWTLGGVFGVGVVLVAIAGARRAGPAVTASGFDLEGSGRAGRHRPGRVPPVPVAPTGSASTAASSPSATGPSASAPETPLAED